MIESNFLKEFLLQQHFCKISKISRSLQSLQWLPPRTRKCLSPSSSFFTLQCFFWLLNGSVKKTSPLLERSTSKHPNLNTVERLLYSSVIFVLRFILTEDMADWHPNLCKEIRNPLIYIILHLDLWRFMATCIHLFYCNLSIGVGGFYVGAKVKKL